MCDPMSILAASGAGTQMMGTFMNAQSQSAQMKYQASIAEQNSKLALMEQTQMEKERNLVAEDIQKDASSLVGQGISGVGASGVDTGSGSVMDWFDSVDRVVKEDVARSNHSYDVGKFNKQVESNNYKSEAQNLRDGRKGVWWGAGISALGQGASGLASTISARNQYKTAEAKAPGSGYGWGKAWDDTHSVLKSPVTGFREIKSWF